MKYIIKRILIIALFISLGGCKNSGTVKDPREIIGRRVILPLNAKWYNRGNVSDSLLINKYKIVTYYEARGCTSCRLRELRSWDMILKECDGDSLNVEVIIVLKSDLNNKEIEDVLNTMMFKHPILFDEAGEFELKNILPENSMLHTFLLNKENKIIGIGSPINSPKLWKSYKHLIINNIERTY